MALVKSTCCYCGVGCGVEIETDGDRVRMVHGDATHPANFGRLCTKGATLHLTAQSQVGRALYPELRRTRHGVRDRVDWDEALDFIADKFAAIIAEYGPDAVAFYVSGQLLTEDYYVFTKLAKGLIGTNNIDTNSRLCMSSAVTGYKLTLGADSVPPCYEDIGLTDCLFIAGANMAYAHPILFRRIEDAKKANPDLMLIVADPRRTDTAASADLHLAILPGTDVALFNAMLNVLIWEDLIDEDFIREHTEQFAELKRHVRAYTPEMAAQVCGISVEQLVRAARLFGQSRNALSFYCMGLNQSIQGAEKNAALINLHLVTGKIGRPGSGPFSLTGQPNAMGGREVGGMATLLNGHRDLDNPAHRAELATLWGVEQLPAQPGKAAVALFESLRHGDIKAVWIACTNPVHSMPDQRLVLEALQRAELVVVQDAFRHTDTTAYADVILPASSWAEKEGTVTNSERRISRVRPAVPAPAEARHDWQIATDFARRLAHRLGQDPDRLFPYDHVEAVFEEHKRTTQGRDLDIGGLSYGVLEHKGPQQWPFKPGWEIGRARLYEDGVFATPTGRARLYCAEYRGLAEATDARYPFHLLTGRLRDQWHGMSRTGRSARLFAHVEEPLLDMNPADLARLGLHDGSLVQVKSRRGTLAIKVHASAEVPANCVFLPMHWSGQLMQTHGANVLTTAAVDPQSQQPELKHAAVRIERLDLSWQMLILCEGEALTLLHQLQPWLSRFQCASLGLFGRERDSVVLRAYHDAPLAESELDALDALIGLDDVLQVTSYSDRKRGISKRVLIRDGLIRAVRLTGETAAGDWLKELMQEGVHADGLRQWVVGPFAIPPSGQVGRGRIICNCLNVSENEIRTAINQGCDLEALKQKLKCGTSCGSCVPELTRMVTGA